MRGGGRRLVVDEMSHTTVRQVENGIPGKPWYGRISSIDERRYPGAQCIAVNWLKRAVRNTYGVRACSLLQC